MDKLIFNATAAMNAQAEARQALTHELANVSTVGFKHSYELATQAQSANGAGFSTRHQPQTAAKDEINLKPGALMATGRRLDIALAKASVLGVQASNGELAFTRRGDLRVSANGVLENGSGHIIRGENGPITIPPGFQVSITQTGIVFATDPAQTGATAPQLIDTLMLRDASETPLARREDGLFTVAGKARGADIQNGKEVPSVIPQALESSNVSALEAMVKMIDFARSFESQIRIIKEAKDMDDAGASMMQA